MSDLAETGHVRAQRRAGSAAHMWSRFEPGVLVLEIAKDMPIRKRGKLVKDDRQARFRVTFEQAPAGMSHVAPDGRWFIVNRRLCEIVGYSREELLVRSFQEITHPDDLTEDLDLMRRLLAGAMPTYTIEKRYIRKDGSTVWINLMVSLVRTPSGDPSYFIAVIEDIDARKRAETALAEENVRLFQAAQVEIREREALISVASHELKSPLTALLGYARLVESRIATYANLRDRDRRALAAIIEQGERLGRMLNTLLDVAQLESGRLAIEREPVDADALVRTIVDEVRTSLALEGDEHIIAHTGVDRPVIVLGDEVRLDQVMRNLLGNALRYSPASSTVAVLVERVGEQLRLTFTDQGIGIPSDALPRLFERFYRAPNVRQYHTQGLGVGLYVVREIVALHGGTVDVISVEGEGSIFTVQLPLA